MPQISSYSNDATVTGADKLLGTDQSGATRNYTISGILASADFSEAIYDYVAAIIQQGSNVIVTPNDSTNQVTIALNSVSVSGVTQSQAVLYALVFG